MQRFHAAVAAAAGAAVLAVAAPAGAGSSVYDMSGLLAEPHPFAAPPPPPPAVPRATGRGAAGPVYDMAPALSQPHPFRAAASPAPAAGPPKAPARTPVVGALPPSGGSPAMLQFALGYFDINDDEDAAELRVEWRGRELWWKLRPLAGVMATSDAAVYAYGGVLVDFELGRRLALTPSFAAGLYEDGSGKDLGSVIEFRSAIELAWRFDSGARLGAAFYHLSNAGIDDNNPGTEVLSFGYTIPLD